MDNPNKQYTSWGYIDWLRRPVEYNQSISIGMIYVEEGKQQIKHIHIGDEQVIITLDGEGIDMVNGESHQVKANDYTYFPPYAMHSTANTGKGYLKQLLISVPINDGAISKHHDVDLQLHDELQSLKLSSEEMESYVRLFWDKFKSFRTFDTKFAIGICDAHGKAIVPYEIPTICSERCKMNDQCVMCPEVLDRIVEYDKWENDVRPSVIVCSNNIVVMASKIELDGHNVGYVIGGFLKTSNDLINTTRDGVINYIHETASGLANMCLERILHYHTQKNIEQYEKEHMKSELLSTSLNEAQSRLLSVEIKNHFLFNTLNTIAAMSLKSDRMEVYKSINNLSVLFRNQLQKTGASINLKEEIEAQRPYIELMRLRYEGKIMFSSTIDSSCEKTKVPFNMLQPIIENAFVHGFSGMQDSSKQLSIKCTNINDKIQITIRDNGCGMDIETLARTRKIIELRDVHGAGMTARLLWRMYGDNYNMDIDSVIQKGTKVIITIPQ